MGDIDWRSPVLGETPIDRAFAAVVREATAALGDVPTMAEGPCVRWYDAGRRITLLRGSDDSTRVVVEEADTAADEEYRAFESLPDSEIPYGWRADEDKKLPNGTYLPGEREVDDFAALGPILARTVVTLTEALADLGTKTSEAQVHAWFADPAHDELVKADRWAARRKTALTIVFTGGAGSIHVQPVGDKSPASRLTFAANAEGAVQAAAAFLAQLTSTGAAVPSSLRQASLVYVDRRKLHLSPFALGIPSMGLWS